MRAQDLAFYQILLFLCLFWLQQLVELPKFTDCVSVSQWRRTPSAVEKSNLILNPVTWVQVLVWESWFIIRFFFYTFTKQEVPQQVSCFLSVLGTWVCFLPWAVSGNNCLVKGSILSHIHFEWLSGGLDGCEWVHSFTAIHSPRQSFPLTHSFRITVWANWLTWIKSFTEINSHRQLFSIIRSPYIHSHKTCHGRNRTRLQNR